MNRLSTVVAMAAALMSMEPSGSSIPEHIRRMKCVDAESRRKALLNRKRRKAERQRRK